MKPNRINFGVALASMMAFGFGALGKSGPARALQMPIHYPSARGSRSKEEAERRIAAAQAKRDRRCKRNLMLLAHEQVKRT